MNRRVVVALLVAVAAATAAAQDRPLNKPPGGGVHLADILPVDFFDRNAEGLRS